MDLAPSWMRTIPTGCSAAIHQFGRYAFSNQPGIIKWNLARLAEALLPFLASDEDKAIAAANEFLKAFDSLYQEAYAAGMGRKLGFARPRDGDQVLIQDLLHRMAEHQADFTATFRALCEASTDPSRDADVRALFSDPAAYDAWAPGWRARLAQEDDAPELRRTRMRSLIRLSSRAIIASRRRSAMRKWVDMTPSIN